MDDLLLGKREIRAPRKDWLTKTEICHWFDISETLLSEWIATGLFPAGAPWTGKDPRWRWIDVVYREVYLEIEARLAHPESARNLPDDPGMARRTTKSPG